MLGMEPYHSRLLTRLHDPRQLLRYLVIGMDDGSKRVITIYPEPGAKPLRQWIRCGTVYSSTNYTTLMDIPVGQGLLIHANTKRIAEIVPITRALRADGWWPYHRVIGGMLIEMSKDKALEVIRESSKRRYTGETLEGW